MRLIILSCFFVLTTSSVFSQNCDCRSEFLWVKAYMEKNHPGFNSDIKTPEESSYKKFTDGLLSQIENDKAGKYCPVYLKRYIRYLKDHHSNFEGFTRPQVNENDPDSLKAFLASPFFQNTERMTIDSAAIVYSLRNADPAGVEGIYITPDTAYTVAVFKNASAMRDYAGVVLASRTKTWQVGQVKMEIIKKHDGGYELLTYLRNHALNYQEWYPSANNFSLPGWRKIVPAVNATSSAKINTDLISFKLLDSQTSLVSIRSFSGQFSRELDSAYRKIIPEIKKYPSLIIDVRNNGGGSDNNYGALMPLLYTDTIRNDFVELFYTDDNRKAYEKMRDETKANPQQYGKTGYLNWEYRINQMKKNTPGSFFPISAKNSFSTYKANNGNPSKIAILYNRNCASSCEQLLLDAAFSKKVKLVGENSGGYIAYGNVMSIKTPCGNYLYWTTTRKNNDRKYEFVGIEPHVKIPATENDWVEYTRRLLQ